ncbi:Flp family type IVb pilin [Aggregatibacter aphrophilus]|uniref:Flp family type IVb pilin n=1 Tax=Aggregatibacter aphrophilus TaxID=732 RepID=UPI000DA41265|nr:Flp family type IVb pilin [Aggregatibacter aphrophilus]SQI99794.1 Flp pilus assembly protein, pilin Flp [Aggregatibacter aphrophilus]
MSTLLGYLYFKLIFSFRMFYQDQRGITSIEYGLIAVVVAVFVVAVLSGDHSFVKAMSSKFSDLTTVVSGAMVSKNS